MYEVLLRIPSLQKQTIKETLDSYVENEHLGTLLKVKLGRQVHEGFVHIFYPVPLSTVCACFL